MTPSHDSVCASITREAKEKVRHQLDEIERTHSRLNEHLSTISNATAAYVATGIADIRELPHFYDLKVHRGEFGRWMWSWTQHFRRLAGELERPFVRIHGYKYDNTCTLCLPRRKYMEPLIAALRLVCSGASRSDTVSWRFEFPGIDNEAVGLWKERCAVDPEFRKILRLP